MKIIIDQITLQELKAMAKEMFGNMVKAVVDVDNLETREKIIKVVNKLVRK